MVLLGMDWDLQEKRCEKCKWRDIEERCRRHPPVWMHHGHDSSAVWPWVDDYDWCGDFEIDD